MSRKQMATGCAILAAALYAVNIPLSKLLLERVEPSMMAAFLYLGAGLGLLLYQGACRMAGREVISNPLTKKELPYTAAMVVLDIAAPILLMNGIARTNSANVSLLNNFEIVATSLIAFLIFKEVISRRLLAALILVTAASVILGFEGMDGFVFNQGSLFVLGACICWGFENNCTKMLSSKSSVEIVTIKGCFSGLGSLVIALVQGESIPGFVWMLAVLCLGFVSYGLSINFYIQAQKNLGAAKTSAYYSVAPFLGAGFSLLLLGERPGLQFYAALVLMIAGTVLMVRDTVALQHSHLHTHVHTHLHRHGDVVHSHEHTHQHTHQHIHGAEEESHTHEAMKLKGQLPGEQHAHAGLAEQERDGWSGQIRSERPGPAQSRQPEQGYVVEHVHEHGTHGLA
ncbi:MAG: DMT family transporter [Lachnospiraceae bacterium]|nr:DMT family transporter [Lachnospiraceae bacterium]